MRRSLVRLSGEVWTVAGTRRDWGRQPGHSGPLGAGPGSGRVPGGGARAVLGCSGSALRVKFSLKIEGNRERWHTGLHCSLHRPRPPCKDKKVIVSSGVVAVILRAAL